MLTVHLAGLIYFNACEHPTGACDPKAFVPDGTKAENGLPPHYASLWVEAERYESDQWWPNEKFTHALEVTERDGTLGRVSVMEFRIPERSTLTFPDQLETERKSLNFSKTMVSLQPLGFNLDPDRPETIAQIPLHGGEIEAFNFADVAVVRWKITDHPDVIEITATPDSDAKAVKKIRLRKVDPILRDAAATLTAAEWALNEFGVEVVFSNGPDQLSGRPETRTLGAGHVHSPSAHSTVPKSNGGRGGNGHAAHRHQEHFKLYGKLDKDRDGDKLLKDPMELQKTLNTVSAERTSLEFNHGFLRFLLAGDELPHNDCTGSCC